MDKIDQVIELVRTDYKFILGDLKLIQKEAGSKETDVRLCVDIDECGDGSWIVRSGDVSYDQQHSQHCGASSIKRGVDAQSVLEDLINQCCDQAADQRE